MGWTIPLTQDMKTVRILRPNGPGGGSPALRRQLGILSGFLQKFPLIDMKPNADALKHAGAAHARALSDGNHAYAVYLDGDGADEIVMNLPYGEYSAEWLNVVTGEVAALEKFLHKGGEKTLRTPKYQGGIALRLQRTPNENRLPKKKGGA